VIKLALSVLEAAIFLISVAITGQLYLSINLIPQALFKYQAGYYDFDDFLVVTIVYTSVSAVILYISKFRISGEIFRSPTLFARELYFVGLSSTVSSLIIFVFTKVFFDPNFILVQILTVVVLFIVLFVVIGVRSNVSVFASFLRELLRYTCSIQGVLIIIVCASPLAMAIYFKKDKDFANAINQIRNLSDGFGLQWQLTRLYDKTPLHQPILVQQHPKVPDSLFVLERSGRLIALDASGEKGAVLDFSKRVGPVEVENGALGFALHPEFANPSAPAKGFVYVHYTDANGDPQINRLSRFDLSLPNQSERLKSETVLIEQNRSTSGFHNGGTVAFGPDGFLYLGIGDGDDKANHQTISNSLFAGIIRIDVDARGGDISHPLATRPKSGLTANYMIPSDNPFVGQTGVLEEFWALGLRNPFRFSFDRDTGTLWAGDVGAEQVEEIDIVVPGGNYQFPYFEGTRRTDADIPKDIIGIDSPPYFDYRHKANERAIIGGIVYRGEKHAALQGKYIFADNAAGQLYAIEVDKTGQTEKRALAKTDQFGYVGITAIVPTGSGDVLVTTLGSKDAPTGRILRLEPRESALFSDIVDMFASLVGHGSGQPHVHGAGYWKMQAPNTYKDNCSRCHGADGRGADNLEQAIARIMPNFADPKWQASRTDDDLANVILKGGAAVGQSEIMPPWEDVLEQAEIDSIIEYIRTFERSAD